MNNQSNRTRDQELNFGALKILLNARIMIPRYYCNLIQWACDKAKLHRRCKLKEIIDALEDKEKQFHKMIIILVSAAADHNLMIWWDNDVFNQEQSYQRKNVADQKTKDIPWYWRNDESKKELRLQTGDL